MAIPYLYVGEWVAASSTYCITVYYTSGVTMYYIILYYIILYNIMLYESVMYYPIRQLPVFFLAIGWPPHSHVPHTFKVERVATLPTAPF